MMMMMRRRRRRRRRMVMIEEGEETRYERLFEWRSMPESFLKKQDDILDIPDG